VRVFFGEDFSFDSDTREVRRSGRPVAISPKAFALLQVLIERRPKAVSKEELHRLLWPDAFVSDANLPNLVGALRAALDDPADAPRIIRTVPRFGYAFESEARTEAPDPRLPVAFRLVWGNREIDLRRGENLFGRDEACVLWIDDPLVSRRHARIVTNSAGATLEDLGSRNGTFLRGVRISSATPLADGDLITIGPASMIFRVLRHLGSTESASGTRSEGGAPA
jgi:DNA-binding winged helix-turn-helix (wHTH) protein